MPDFLAKKFKLHLVLWQPKPSPYRILAIYRGGEGQLQARFDAILGLLCEMFSGI